MKQGVYYHLQINATGQRTPWSRHSIDFFPYVAGDTTQDFDTVEALEGYLKERYGALPKKSRTVIKHEGKPEHVMYKHWVNEKPSMYHNTTPMDFYKIEHVFVTKITHYEEEIIVK
jgi:hypothetical protein